MAAQPTPLLVIAGPTASGKTSVAVSLAHQINGEIISADSMQVYQYLSIGTAKPTPGELEGVSYHLIDYVPPGEQYHLGRFITDAENQLRDIQSRRRTPILCGGTGLYLKGLLYGVFEGGEKNPEIRHELEARLKTDGLDVLFRELLTCDPESALNYGSTDRQRILRALEVFLTTGVPLSQLQSQNKDQPRYAHSLYVLSWPRDILYKRINERVNSMHDSGILDEVRFYLDQGFDKNNPAIKALGYRELIAWAEGTLPLEDALEVMKKKSRNYAKRQETWFRAMPGVRYVSCSGKSICEISRFILNDWKNRQTDVSP